MRVFSTVMKIVAAIAAVVGAIYVVATYGDRIVAWAKKTLAKCPVIICDEEPVVEEPAAEEAPVEEVPAEEAPAEETVAEEGVPVADETDFEG